MCWWFQEVFPHWVIYIFTCFLTSLPVVLCLVLTHLEFQLHFLISNANVALPSRLLSSSSSSSSLTPFFFANTHSNNHHSLLCSHNLIFCYSLHNHSEKTQSLLVYSTFFAIILRFKAFYQLSNKPGISSHRGIKFASVNRILLSTKIPHPQSSHSSSFNSTPQLLSSLSNHFENSEFFTNLIRKSRRSCG